MENSPKKKWNNQISVAKAIGIVLMVVGHSGCPLILNRLIYSFHIPLFFFLSGYFMRFPDSNKDLSSSIIRKLKGLYIPYVKWSVVFLLFHNAFYKWHILTSNDHSYSWWEILNRFIHIVCGMGMHDSLLGPFWFLRNLLLSSIISLFIVYFVRHSRILPLIILLLMSVVFSYWEPDMIFDISLRDVFYGGSFFYSGYLFHIMEGRLTSPKRVYNNGFFMVSFLVLFVVVILSLPDGYTFMTDLRKQPYHFAIALIGIYVVMFISYVFRECDTMQFIGKSTMDIFALHLLCFKLVSLVLVLSCNMSVDNLGQFPVIEGFDHIWILYSIVGVVSPLLLADLYNIVIRKVETLISYRES